MADVVLANSTCFDMNLMNKVSERAKFMKVGAFMITLTKKLPTSDPLIVRDLSKREWNCVYSIKK